MKERRTRRRSAKCEIVTLTVAFNIRDPHQRALLEQAERLPNFSGAVKRLLAGEAQTPMLETFAPPVDQVSSVEQSEFDPIAAFL